MNGVFVTGTDTNVGKTVVSAVIVAALRKDFPVCYWKPVQTGIESDSDTNAVADLAKCAPRELFEKGIRLEQPVSPHLAARLAGQDISVADIVDLGPDDDDTRFMIIEGAGGVMVPLNEREFMVDLISEIGLPAVIVSRSGLGTINHTLLTVGYLRGRGITPAGVIMIGEPNKDNREAIEKYGQIRVLAEIPILEPVSFDSVSNVSSRLSFNFIKRPRAA